MHTHPPPDRGKMGAMLDAARAVGITRVIMSSLGYTDMVPYPSPEDVRRGNEEVLSLVDRYRGLVYGYVYVNPNHADALKVVEEGLARPGIVGIKLWISCRDEAGRLDPVYPVLELAAGPPETGAYPHLLPHALQQPRRAFPHRHRPPGPALPRRAHRNGAPGRQVAPGPPRGAALPQRVHRSLGHAGLPGERGVRRGGARRGPRPLRLRRAHPRLRRATRQGGGGGAGSGRQAPHPLGQQRPAVLGEGA